MAQPGTTGGQEPPADRSAESDRSLQPERQLVRLQPGGGRRAIGVAFLIVALLLVVVWQPWGGRDRASSPSTPGPLAGGSAAAQSNPSPAPSATPDAIDAYLSLTDNEWTVVALLVADAPVSTEEPATQHAPAWAPDGPFNVLQQGLRPVVPPTPREGQPEVTCEPTVPPRERSVVTVPAGRVVFLGVTFPGMDPRAEVTASTVDGTGVQLAPVSPLVVRLVGRTDGRRYSVPSTGPGGAILFAMTPPGILPAGAYRFEVTTPTIVGRRLLYACVG